MLIETKIISAFPGTGKTWCKNNYDKLTIMDSDSSTYSWLSPGVRNPEFPDNYIKHIRENMGKVDVIFVSSHEQVREALAENKIPYFLVYPNIGEKYLYKDRYRERGSEEDFIKMLDIKWEQWIGTCERDDQAEAKISLSSGKYIDTILDRILSLRTNRYMKVSESAYLTYVMSHMEETFDEIGKKALINGMNKPINVTDLLVWTDVMFSKEDMHTLVSFTKSEGCGEELCPSSITYDNKYTQMLKTIKIIWV